MRSHVFRPWTVLFGTLAAFMLLPQTSVEAQQRVERYQPARPALSPYLDMFRDDTGLTDPFNNFIVPGRRMRSTARQFQREIAGQQQTINQLQQQVQGQLEIRPSGARPTGTGATFMNYSHYFSRGGGRR